MKSSTTVFYLMYCRYVSVQKCFANSLHDATKNCQVHTGGAKKCTTVPPVVITELLFSHALLIMFWRLHMDDGL